MKRIVIIAIACFIITVFPIKSYADYYEQDGLTIYFNENVWLVITKDNINDDFSEYGVGPDFVKQMFNENKTLFIDAVKLDDNTDFLIRIDNSNGMPDLSTLSEEELEGEFLDTLKRESRSANCDIYELGGYYYGVAEYYDEKSQYYLFTLVTIEGGKTYTFTAQKAESFWRSEKDEFMRIVDEDVRINPVSTSAYQNNSIGIGPFTLGGITGAVVIGGILCLVGIVIGKKRKKVNASDENSSVPNGNEESKKTNTEANGIINHFRTEESNMIPIDELRQLKLLHEEGVLTDEEYEVKKRQLLNI